MRTISLSKGYSALIDDEDFERVNKLKWYASITKNGHVYARHDLYVKIENGKEIRKRLSLHRFIMSVEDPGTKIDHKDGNTLDNRKENLRIATTVQNNRNRNRQGKNNTTSFRGIWEYKRGKCHRWTAFISNKEGKRVHIGYFKTPEEAAKAFDKAAKEMYGEFCGELNFG